MYQEPMYQKPTNKKDKAPIIVLSVLCGLFFITTIILLLSFFLYDKSDESSINGANGSQTFSGLSFEAPANWDKDINGILYSDLNNYKGDIEMEHVFAGDATYAKERAAQYINDLAADPEITVLNKRNTVVGGSFATRIEYVAKEGAEEWHIIEVALAIDAHEVFIKFTYDMEDGDDTLKEGIKVFNNFLNTFSPE